LEDQAMAGVASTTNVVRLPTAAPRKVSQHHNRNTRALKLSLPQFPGKYISPGVRAMLPVASALEDLRHTPELELLIAMCTALGDDARFRIEVFLREQILVGNRAASQALAGLRKAHMSIRESYDLWNAMDHLEGR
jgi:hypothetical protein